MRQNLSFCTGSPPHTWRIPTVAAENNSSGGITSTHVENTHRLSSREPINKDHLHTRGEYKKRGEVIDQKMGSPPHTWRIQRFSKRFKNKFGITSTHVENTLFDGWVKCNGKDHLHTRGEYRRREEDPEREQRITSTHVENTFANGFVEP
mgnify:CR=1 FL=1